MIEIIDMKIVQGDFELCDLTIKIPEGEYAVLMGRTGCGKTTIIEAICGLRPIHSGKILLNGRDVTHEKPALRGIGYVPQDGALFHTMTVRQNLGFALELRGTPTAEVSARVQEVADQLVISSLLDRGVIGLSGGERQRVALGRALAFNPAFLLMDEPLSAVDEETHEEMCAMLSAVCRSRGVTTLHVTHNSTEASVLSDRIFRLEEGRIVVGDASPRTIHP